MSNNNHYLLEIGTEELPVDFLMGAIGELSDKLKAVFDEQNIAYDDVQVFATPRRLAVIVKGLPEQQAERAAKTKGPPIKIALDAEGKPSQAGQGFARKLGVDFSELVQEEIDGETYMVLNQTIPGRKVPEMLSETLPSLVLGLSGSHFMAWGDYEIRFSRPIRWLLSLWNDEHLPVTIGPVTSSNITHGHRVLSNGPITIRHCDDYITRLEKEGSVIVDQKRRRESIWNLLQASAKEIGGSVPENEGLLDTVTMLVERPSIVVGQFKKRFLEIPEEVTTTVMAAHQKYFPVRGENGDLQPYFLAVSNGKFESSEIIRHGNEKVITARLEDARFFFDEDQKTKLEDRVKSLSGMTFQKGLGSLEEKTARLEKLAVKVGEALGQDAATLKLTQRAARLSKADLVTGMVFEFTELQGVMGKKYAAIGGEPAAVADAIYEHYLPRFMGDDVATSQPGIAVSLADKLDTIVAVFSQQNAKLPSGSKDPLGLRRMATGIIQTVLENKLSVDLTALMGQTFQLLRESLPNVKTFTEEQATVEMVSEFTLQRFRGLLLEQGIRHDIIDAVFESGNPPLSNIQDVIVRLDLMRSLTANADQLKQIDEPANRIYKILSKNYRPDAKLADVKPQHLKDDSEKALYELVKTLPQLDAQRSRASYDQLIAALLTLNPVVATFFEKVMVNDPDAEVRENRYNLLSLLNRVYLQVACFTRLQA